MLGIPPIVFTVEVLLSRPVLGAALTPAALASIVAAIYYFRLDIAFLRGLRLKLKAAIEARLAIPPQIG